MQINCCALSDVCFSGHESLNNSYLECIWGCNLLLHSLVYSYLKEQTEHLPQVEEIKYFTSEMSKIGFMYYR